MTRPSPISVKAKTTYKGMVGIRDKYCEAALAERRDILVILEDGAQGLKIMRIYADHIETDRISISPHRMRDKFGGEGHFLWYYDWHPTTVQEILI